MGNCALITPVYLEIALFSGARSGTQTTGQVISAIETADISIRALREEGDRKGSGTAFADGAISIHALREEGDVQLGAFVLLDHLFLSTPSARRATFRAARFQQGEVHFYPHPP